MAAFCFDNFYKGVVNGAQKLHTNTSSNLTKQNKWLPSMRSPDWGRNELKLRFSRWIRMRSPYDRYLNLKAATLISPRSPRSGPCTHHLWVTFTVWACAPSCLKMKLVPHDSVSQERISLVTYSDKLDSRLCLVCRWRPEETWSCPM